MVFWVTIFSNIVLLTLDTIIKQCASHVRNTHPEIQVEDIFPENKAHDCEKSHAYAFVLLMA